MSVDALGWLVLWPRWIILIFVGDRQVDVSSLTWSECICNWRLILLRSEIISWMVGCASQSYFYFYSTFPSQYGWRNMCSERQGWDIGSIYFASCHQTHSRVAHFVRLPPILNWSRIISLCMYSLCMFSMFRFFPHYKTFHLKTSDSPFANISSSCISLFFSLSLHFLSLYVSSNSGFQDSTICANLAHSWVSFKKTNYCRHCSPKKGNKANFVKLKKKVVY